ncbi:glycosyltransferase [Cytobacillus gottheilii]|uniref:glycosyltransferase n=1 Tax=Cytobacillus gottheilii TaxID=859144 RepID=UPI00249582C8|nr:glycosyltransferase [Cytobacillus gottheilii]
MEVQNNYSVLMSVYHKESPENLKCSLKSMFSQTIVTNDFVLMCDGPLTEDLEKVITDYQKMYQGILNVYRFDENMGLGVALRKGVLNCKNEIIARMDSDDIAVTSRCEKQLLEINKGYDIVGSNIDEFINAVDNIVATRIVPEKHEDILQFIKKRNPFNHPSVMYRKSQVLEAGNYRNEYRLEDYYLWVDMLGCGCVGYNIQENLVRMRSTEDMYKRRSGKLLIKSLLKLRKYMLQNNIINIFEFTTVTFVQTILAIIPNGLRSLLYRKILRG